MKLFKPLLFFLFASGITYWLFFISASDEFQEVRIAYRELLEEAAVTGDTPPLERLFKAKKVASAFHKEVEGEIVSKDPSGTEEVLRRVRLTRKRIEQRLVGAYRISKEVRPEIVSDTYSKAPEGIELLSTLRVYGDKPGDEVMYLEELKLQVLFVEDDGDWFIRRATIERVPRNQ